MISMDTVCQIGTLACNVLDARFGLRFDQVCWLRVEGASQRVCLRFVRAVVKTNLDLLFHDRQNNAPFGGPADRYHHANIFKI